MRTVSLVFLSLLCLALADKNTTFDDTDASIQYSDGGRTLPCALDANGNFVPGQAGCFNNGPKNCSSGGHILQTQSSTLSMQFKGSAIYLNALLDDISNIYTITLDGKSTDVDGVRPGGALLCYTLFSQSNLDPNADHNISLSIKGLSPARNTTLGNDNIFSFLLDNFVVTTPDSGGNSSSSVGGASGTATSPSSSTSPTAGSSGALSRMITVSPWVSFWVVVSMLFHL